MALDPLLISNGLTSLIVSVVSIVTGLKLASKYLQHRDRVLLLAGMTWLLMYEGWWAPSISFIFLLITNQSLPIELFFLISMSFTPIAITLWMVAFTDLKYKKLQKPILIIFLTQTIFFEVFSFYFLLTESSVIIESVGIIDAEYKSFVIFFLIEIAVLLIVTGTLFARESLKLDKPEIRLKGKFLLLGFFSLTIGALFDAFLALEIISLLLYRSLLVFSSFAFYFGFFLPKSLKKLFLKKDTGKK